MPKQLHQRREALFAPGVDILAGIVEETGAGAHADAAFLHIARDHLGRAIAVAVQRAFKIAAGVIENVAAAPVDEFQEPHRRIAKAETVFDGFVDVLRAGDAFLDHPRGFVHGQRLDPRHDVAGRRRAYDGHLADAFEQCLDARGDRGIGDGAGRQFDQRDQIGRVEPVHVEETPGMLDRA